MALNNSTVQTQKNHVVGTVVVESVCAPEVSIALGNEAHILWIKSEAFTVPGGPLVLSTPV